MWSEARRLYQVRFPGGGALRRAVGAALVTVLGICGAVAAQTEQPAADAPSEAMEPVGDRSISVATVEARRQAAESAGGVDDSLRRTLADLYRRAAEALARADKSAARAQSLRQDAESVQQRLAQLQQMLEQLRATPAIAPRQSALGELEQELAQADRHLAELKQNSAVSEAEPSTRIDRRREVRNLLLSTPLQLQELDLQLDAPAPRDEPALLTLARRSELLARRMALEQETAALQNELSKYDAEDAVDFVRLQRDVNLQRVALAERQYQLLDARVKQLRDESARESVRQADEEVYRALPLLKTYAERNKALAAETQRLTQLTSQTDRRLQQVRAELENVQVQFAQSRERVASIGLTRTVGAQLRKQKAALPDVHRRCQDIEARQTMIEDVRFESFTLDDERTLLAKPEVIVEQILAEMPPEISNAERERMRDAAGGLLDRKREYLDNLIRIQNVYFDTLTTLDTTEQKLVNQTDDFIRYIHERVFWIRSGRPLTADFGISATELALLDPAEWLIVAKDFATGVRQTPSRWGWALALFAALVALRRRIRWRIRELGESAARPQCTRFGLTMRAALLTLLLAATWPALCGFVSWRLTQIPSKSAVTGSVAAGLWALACAYFALEILRHSCRRHGLAEAHFHWSPPVVQVLRKSLLGLTLFLLPLVFLTTMLYSGDLEQGAGVLQRLFFIAACAVVAVFLGRMLRPGGGLLRGYLALHRDGWLERLKYVWYGGCVAAPLTLAALAHFGFFYTAQQLSARLFHTFCLVLLLVVIRAMLLRLLLVYRRQLSIRQARERRAAALAALGSEPAAGTRSRSMTMMPVEEVVDLGHLSSQTQRIVTSLIVATAMIGVWGIWDDVVPALRILDNWVVWSTFEQVAENVADAGQEPVVETHNVLQVVSVADMLLALLVGVITLIAFRNLPGLLEMAVLQRLPLETSVRYAITALASYAIIMVGGVVAAGTLGLRWSQIQWLATALTFGLAFGLQEMFANFVAGLIILFERPVRVGDVVTVGDTTGVVSRVRIRATTITNWDRKEFVVPNKEFITGRLLNWTLSDQVNRVVIAVGVAYGSPTEQVRELLLKIAKDHPLILDNPEPIVTFDSFGDSALNFSLRVFLPTLEKRLTVTHDLHTAIHLELQKAGIAIPFPQRDLHIHTAASTAPATLAEAVESPTLAARKAG